MPDRDYIVKRIGPEDFPLLIPLMKDCFGMDTNIDYFRWKYTQNPAGGFVGFVAEHRQSGEIGGYYGVIPQLLELDGKQRVIFQSCDTMTHSAHRRRGLFRKLALTCYDELRKEDRLFVIGFGGGQSTPGFLKFGWRKLFDFRYYFKPAFMCRFSGRLQEGSEQVIICSVDEAMAGGLNINQSSSARARIAAVRNPEQVKWRLSNPNHDYQVARLPDDPSYCIYYLEGDKLFLFDFLLDRPRSSRMLMAKLHQEVLNRSLRGMVAFCQENAPDARSLQKLGFWTNPFSRGPLNEKVPFILFATEEEMNRFSAPSDWFVTTYDHDAL